MDIAQYILEFAAGLGALLVGLKIFSETIEKLLGKQLTKLFDKTAKNKFAGVGVGVATAALLHSSSATTVMVVGLANMGVLPLAAATTIIIGANIGTTVTAQITALGTLGGGESLSFSLICMGFTVIGIFINMMVKNDKAKIIGYSLSGFGLIFFGLYAMSTAVSGLINGSAGEAITNAFTIVTNPFLLLLIGVLVTGIIQSSTAVTSILISMVAAGLTIGNGGDCILYIILGTNIGTCVTAIISSIGTNTNAKRTSMIHLIFNIVGSVIFMVFLLIWNACGSTSFMDLTFGSWFKGYPAIQVSMFHTFFNLVTALIFIPLSDQLVKVVTIIVPETKDDKKRIKTHRLNFTDKRLLGNSPLAIVQLRKESMKLAETNLETLEVALNDFEAKSSKNEKEIIESIEESNAYANEIVQFIIKLTSTGELNESDAKDASSLHHVIADVVRIAEVSDNVVKYTRKFKEENLQFSKVVDGQLLEMLELSKEMYKVTNKAFITKDVSLLKEVDAIEERLDKKREEVIEGHIKRLNAGECHFENVAIFVNLVSNLERVGDHINFIAHTIESK